MSYFIELEIGEPISTFVFSKNDWEKTQRDNSFISKYKKRRDIFIMSGTKQDYIDYRVLKSNEIFENAETHWQIIKDGIHA